MKLFDSAQTAIAEFVSQLGKYLSLPLGNSEPARQSDHFTFDATRTAQRVANLDRYLLKTVLRHNRFICKHRQTCRASHRGTLLEAQAPHVGRYYDLQLNEHPFRILIVSPGHATGPARASRLTRYEQIMSSALKSRFKADGEYEARDLYMRGITSVLRLLFKKDVGSDYASEHIHFANGGACHLFEAFALASPSLCSAVNSTAKDQLTRTMSENCISHFRQTIAILDPTIVVVLEKSMDKWLRKVFDGVENLGGQLRRVTLGDRNALVAIFAQPDARAPHNWGANESAPYLLETVRPTIERLHRILVIEEQKGLC